MRYLTTERGYSLLELTFIFGIIGLLALIVIPNFLNSREKGNDTAAMTMLKEMDQAIRLYYEENFVFPSSINDLAPEYIPEIPSDGIYEYIRSTSGKKGFKIMFKSVAHEDVGDGHTYERCPALCRDGGLADPDYQGDEAGTVCELNDQGYSTTYALYSEYGSCL